MTKTHIHPGKESDGPLCAKAGVSRWKMPEHYVLGLFCIFIGIGAIWIARDYPYGTLTAMGPGFMPTVIAAILVLLGIVIMLLRGSDARNEGQTKTSENTPCRSNMMLGTLRVIVFITGGILLFGVSLRGLGLAISTFVLVVLACLAQPDVRMPSVLLLAVSITVASCFLFVMLLGLEVPVFPEF
jgi:hypothetical protein